MQIYVVGKDHKLISVVPPLPIKAELEIGESVDLFDRRRMDMNIAEVLPTKEDNLNSFNRLKVGNSYLVRAYFPSRVGEEKFTGKLIEKEFVENEYPVFKFNTNKGIRIVSTFDLNVTLTRIEDPSTNKQAQVRVLNVGM